MAEEDEGRDCGNGWVAYLTDDGEEYYYHKANDETVWELPGQGDDEQEQSEDLTQGGEGESLQRTSSRTLSRQDSKSDIDPATIARPSDSTRERRLTVEEVNR